MGYIKRKSQKQEKRTASAFGGKTVVASGALWGSKGDARTDSFLIENKFTDEDFYVLKRDIWAKIEKEAISDGLRTPLMQIDVQDVNLVVCDDATFNILNPGFLTFNVMYIKTSKKSVKLEPGDISKLVQFDRKTYYPYIRIEFNSTCLIVLTQEDFLYMLEESDYFE